MKEFCRCQTALGKAAVRKNPKDFLLSATVFRLLTFAPMPKAKTNKPKIRTRYSIGEWYGAGFELLTPAA
jgi:hypothetical protein